MTKEQQHLKEHFLEAETRDGYFVDANMKASWKVLLDILEEFMRVAGKYNLKWSMEGGSLLGAIRHKGFIPWDDDIDVVMPRKDYDKLIDVLPGELPPHLYAQTTRSNADFHIPHLMICDSRTTGIDISHVKWKKHFNMGIRIDVLPLDGMPCAPIRFLVRKYISFIMNGIPPYPADWPRKSLYAKVKYRIGRLLFLLFGNKGLYTLREFPLRMLPMERYEWCGSLCARNFWHPHSIRKTEWFREYKRVPFEYIDVNIPVDAERILTQQFGDWRKPVKGTSFHGGLILDPHTPYKKVLVERFGYVPESLAKLP